MCNCLGAQDVSDYIEKTSEFHLGNRNILTDKADIEKAKSDIYKRFPERFLHFYMNSAFEAAKLSYCVRNKIGSTLVTPDNVMIPGFNGTVSGMPNVCEIEGQDVTDPRTLHSESNSISKVACTTLSTRNASLFVTHSTCIECAKLVVQAKIRRVFYTEEYRIVDGINLLADSRVGVQVIRMKKENDFYVIDRIHNHFTPIETVY